MILCWTCIKLTIGACALFNCKCLKILNIRHALMRNNTYRIRGWELQKNLRRSNILIIWSSPKSKTHRKWFNYISNNLYNHNLAALSGNIYYSIIKGEKKVWKPFEKKLTSQLSIERGTKIGSLSSGISNKCQKTGETL